MAHQPPLSPPDLSNLGRGFRERAAASTAQSSGLAGLQIQELLARIKAQETSALEGQKSTSALNQILLNKNILSPTARTGVGADVGTDTALDRLRQTSLASTDAASLANRIKGGLFPMVVPGETGASATAPGAKIERALPPSVQAAIAQNPNTINEVRREVSTVQKTEPGGPALGPAKVKETTRTTTKRGGLPGSGVPSIALPTIKSATESESERLQAQALEKMRGSLDEATIKAIFAKLKPGEIIVDFDPATKKVIIRRPGGTTARQ